ncbi:hypothetical protein IVB32_21560 [Bradyrhizobium sp. 23]|nr:hypothetical protein [Bradyrhizobium sp. 23]
MAVPSAPNDRWSLDFISDQRTHGRGLRILTVIDECTRVCLVTLPPLFIQWDLESDGLVKCSPKLGQLMLEFSGV